MQPHAIAGFGRGCKGCVERPRHFVGRGQIDRVGRCALRHPHMGSAGIGYRAVECRFVHSHAGLQIRNGPRFGDQNLRMPDGWHIADQAPEGDRQPKRENSQTNLARDGTGRLI